MKFNEIKEQSYFRDRNDDNYDLDKYAYFEELRVLKKEDNVMQVERIHIYFNYSEREYVNVDRSARDEMDFKKENWTSWEDVNWISEKEVYRRVIKLLFENNK